MKDNKEEKYSDIHHDIGNNIIKEPPVVYKFGGTCVANIEKIQKVASIIIKEKAPVVVVVSAMAGVTNELVNYVQKISSPLTIAERSHSDTVVSAGEQITIGLLALAIENLGFKARSCLGWQIPIYTDGQYGSGKIIRINSEFLVDLLDKNIIPVIAGFQGVYKNNIVTLGRGGSDTTAVAVAAALHAARCDIFTDVNGIYTADPKIVHNPKPIRKMSHAEALAISHAGAKVLHRRAALIAIRHRIELRILSTQSFDLADITFVTHKGKEIERGPVTAIVSDNNITAIHMFDIFSSNNGINQKKKGILTLIMSILNKAGITIKAMSYKSLGNLERSIIITMPSEQSECAYMALAQNNDISFKKILIFEDVAGVSVVGTGIQDNLELLEMIFDTLDEKKIEIINFVVSEIRIDLLMNAKDQQLAVQSLHDAFRLGV